MAEADSNQGAPAARAADGAASPVEPPAWAVRYASEALQRGVKVPEVERELVRQGLPDTLAAVAVERWRMRRIREITREGAGGFLDPIPEPWAKLMSVLTTIGIGVLALLLMDNAFGVGIVCGAVICAVLHWGARLSERRIWHRLTGGTDGPPEEEPEGL
jgi:hypothetical protein